MNEYELKLDKYIGLVRLLCKSYESAKRARPMAFNDRKANERKEIQNWLQKVKDSGGKAFQERDMKGWLLKG